MVVIAGLQAGWFELFSGHLSEGNLRLYRRLGCRPFRQARVRPGLTRVYLEKRKGEGAVDGCGTEPR